MYPAPLVAEPDAVLVLLDKSVMRGITRDPDQGPTVGRQGLYRRMPISNGHGRHYGTMAVRRLVTLRK